MSSQRSFTFRHPEFETRDGPLGYFAAERATVLVGAATDSRVFQICQIIFNRRIGSVYAQFSYFGAGTGVAAEYAFEPGKESQTIKLGETGLAFSSHIKYSHPPDGRAHFSQDGKVVTKIRRQSFPLNGPEGHLFEIHAYQLDGFQTIEPGAEKRKRLYLPWFFRNYLPHAVTVAVEWRRKSELSKLIPPGVDQFGPLVELPRWHDGRLYRSMLVGQPEGFPLQDHLLSVNVGSTKEVDTAGKSALIFFGGWDEHEATHNPRDGEGYLTFMSPAGSLDSLEAAGRSMDYDAGEPDAGG